MIEIVTLPTPDDVAAEAASRAAKALAEAQERQPLVTFGLAGGRSPVMANRILAETYAHAFDWRRVLFFIGDERYVPRDHPDANWRTARPLFDMHPEIPDQRSRRPRPMRARCFVFLVIKKGGPL